MLSGFISDALMNLAVTNQVLDQFLQPLILSLVGLAGVVSTLFIIVGGFSYISSKGNPERIHKAKRIIRNALLGLVVVIAAGTLVSILNDAYSDTSGTTLQNIPTLTEVAPVSENGGLTEVLLKAIIGLFQNIIETAGKPFIAALDYFTHSTPLMAENPNVMKLWVAMLAIANSLFILVVVLLGFQIMSSSALGYDELDFKQLLPKLGLTFLGMNVSIFIIDFLISLSNIMINALESTFNSLSVWEALNSVVSNSGGQGIVALLIMVVFLILATILLVYYVMRIVTLYVGAILSPIVVLLASVPGFRDFSITAGKVYLTNIFVLFVHVVILLLAATLFAGLKKSDSEIAYDPVMSSIVGVASLVALLKTQGLMMQLSYVSVGPKALRKLGGQFMNGVHYTTSASKQVRGVGNLSTPKSRRPISGRIQEYK